MPLSFDPEYAKALEPLLPMLAAHPSPKVHDVQGRRQMMDQFAEATKHMIPEAPGISIDTLTIKSYDRVDIVILHVYPKETLSGETSAAYIHAHGGGMIVGSAETFIKSVALIAAATQLQFFSVNYRKAPENPHPAPTEDVYAALTWVKENAAKFNIDPSRIGIMGESSGGGVAAGVAIMARDRKMRPPLAKQVLWYPMLDDRNVLPIKGLEEFAFWKSVDNLTSWTALLGDKIGKDDVSPYAAPARVDSVEGLPPIYIDIGELDIFKAENIEYITRFAKANISTEFHLYPGLPHGWEVIAPQLSATKRAMENRIRALISI